MNKLSVVVCILCLLVLSAAAYRRNDVWHDNITLWTDAVQKSPQRSRSHNNLGKAYLLHAESMGKSAPDAAGYINTAIRHFETALQTDPVNAKAHFNLGIAQERLGRYNAAMENYRAAVAQDHDFVEAYFNLGLLCLAMGDAGEARRQFASVLFIDPANERARNFLNMIKDDEQEAGRSR